MSVKTETVEVRRCDFCINTKEARTCQHCSKDACENCGRIFKLISEYWNASPLVSVFGSGSAYTFSAFICHDCEKNELTTQMLRFGFDGAMDEALRMG